MRHKDEVDEVEPVLHPVLRMDGIRIATLIVLGLVVVSVIALGAFLVTNVHEQRERNECYQEQLEALTDWAQAAVQAGRSDRQAQRELLLAQDTPNDGAVALQRYLDRLDEADRTRRTAPVPDQRCS